MRDRPAPAAPIGLRALNRATLARQLLLERSTMSIPAALEHLVGLQAQTPHTAYTGLWSRLEAFEPQALSDLIVDRRVVRLALMRGTIHMVTARDAWGLRPLVQPVLDRVQKSQFAKRLVDVDLDAVIASGRAFVDAEPRTFKALGDHLLERWPGSRPLRPRTDDQDGHPARPGAAARTVGPERTDRPHLDPGLAGRTAAGAGQPRWAGDSLPGGLRPGQRHGCTGVVRADPAGRRVRQSAGPGLLTFRDESGRELFDLPDAPRPGGDVPAPPRFLYDFDNLLLSHADRTRAISAEVADAVRPAIQEPVSTFTLDGFVAGTWRIEREKPRGAATLRLRPIRPLTKRDTAGLTDEGAGLLAFLAADSTEHRIRVEQPLTTPCHRVATDEPLVG